MKEVRDKSLGDLRKMLAEKEEALRRFRFSVAGSRSRNVKEGKNLRGDIARILTEINSRNNEVKS